MKKNTVLSVAAIALLLTVGFNSCKKITEDNLINGLWKLTTVNIDTTTTNYLHTLPNYTMAANCCAYKLDFEKDGTLISFYLTDDSLNYVVAGKWYATKYQQVYMKVDNFIDGTFDVESPSIKKRILTSEKNHIKAFDGINPALDTTYTKLIIEKL